jgi:hypothetical protein
MEYTAIDAPSIVEKISYGDLQFFKVGRGGWRRDVRPSRGLGGHGSVGWGGIYRGGSSRADTVRSEAGEEGGYIPEIGNG